MTIENAKIKSVNLSMKDHGCLTLEMWLQGNGWDIVYGGYAIGNGYLGAKNFNGNEKSAEYIMRIMDTVGAEKFNDMTGKYIRVETNGWGEPIDKIGNIVEDKWFSQKEFFKDNEAKTR